jgi:peptidoglycan/xylan/chitin deacetylase (PgdA/CDA1 family)
MPFLEIPLENSICMFIIILLIFILVFATLISLFLTLLDRDLSANPPTLLLHSVYKGDRSVRSLSEISEKNFTDFCCQLKLNGFRFSTVENSVKSISQVPLTFDDGFESIYDVAAPILREFGGRATLFVTTAHFVGRESIDVYENQKKLSRNQIKELYRDGFEIGSHTVTHRALPFLCDDDIYEELSESKRVLEEIVGDKIELLSFPLGLWDNRVIRIAKEVGYSRFYTYGGVRRSRKFEEITPVLGVYPFENSSDLISKIRKEITPTVIASKIVPHFAKGSPLWKFDKSYSLLRALSYANPLK